MGIIANNAEYIIKDLTINALYYKTVAILWSQAKEEDELTPTRWS